MSSVRQKCGKWYYRITVTNGDGSHKWIERGGFSTKKEAQDAGNKAEVLLKDGELVIKQKSMTFKTLAEEYLKFSESTCKFTSINIARRHLEDDVIPFIGDYDIHAISTRNCQEIVNHFAEIHMSLRRLDRIKSSINCTFKYAITQGYLKDNPAKNVIIPLARSEIGSKLKPARESRALPKEEIDAIFKRFPEGHPYFIPFVLGYRCGLRVGEVFGLLVSDIDFKSHCLHIRRQVQYDIYSKHRGDLYFTSPKYCNPGEGRDVYLDDDTLRILRRHVDKLLKCQSIFHYPSYYMRSDGLMNMHEGTLIFPVNLRYEDGTYISPRNIRNGIRVIHGKESHFDYVDPNFHFHELRHTHASECLAAGMSPVSVQKRLGHKNLQTTLQYYVHETKSQETESKDILERMYQ